MVQTRTADRPNGPCRVHAPLSSTETDDGKGRGVGTSSTTRPRSGASTPQAAGTEYLSLTSKMCLPPSRGLTGCPLCLECRNGFCGAPWSKFVDCVPVVPLLHTSEPQMVDPVVEVLKILDHSVPGGKAGKATRVPWLFMRHASPRSSLLEPQVVEQLVEVPILPTVTLADGKDDRGIRWRHVWGRSGGTYWWMVGTNHTRRNRPVGFTAGPGRYTNTVQLHLTGG